MINSQLSLSQDTPRELYNVKSLLIFNASNKQLYGNSAIDCEENSLHYYTNLYYTLLLPCLLSIIENSNNKFTIAVYFRIANEDFEQNSEEETYLENLFNIYNWYNYNPSKNILVGIDNLFNSEILNIGIVPTSVILETEKSFIL